MRIGIMQPYFFPSKGYFQLIKDCDMFLFIDDKPFTGNFQSHYLFNDDSTGNTYIHGVPKRKAGSSTPLNQIKIKWDQKNWHRRFMYNLIGLRSPYYFDGVPAYEFYKDMTKYEYLSDLTIASISFCCRLMDITTPMGRTSDYAPLSGRASGAARYLDLCLRFKATDHLNLYSDIDFYLEDLTEFPSSSVSVSFLDTTEYNQNSILQWLIYPGNPVPSFTVSDPSKITNINDL